MSAQVVAHQYELLPPRARRLHEMSVVRPGAWNTFSEQHFARQPCLVFRHIPVTQRLERLDRGRARFGHVEDPDEYVDDRLRSEPGYSSASDVLDRGHDRPESGVEARPVLFKLGGPGRVVVADRYLSAAVPLHDCWILLRHSAATLKA